MLSERLTTLLPALSPERAWRLSREMSWILLGQFLVVVGSFVGIRLLTEFLTPAAYGELALGLTLATLVNQTLFGPLNAGISRFYAPAIEAGDFPGYLRATQTIVRKASIAVVLVAVIAVSVLLGSYQKRWIPLVVAALALSLVSGHIGVLGGIQSAARRRAVVALHQGMDASGRYIVAIALMWFLGVSSTAAMCGYAISTAIVLGSQYHYFRGMPSTAVPSASADSAWGKEIYAFCWPMSVFGIFTWGQLVSDRWALEHFASREAVGRYAVLFQLGYYPITLASSLAMQFLAPILYQRAGDATTRSRNAHVSRLTMRLTLLVLGGTVLASLVAQLYHEQIFARLVAQEYRSVSYLLPLTVLSGGIMAAGQALALDFLSQLRTRAIMTAKCVTALLGIALNVAGAYYYSTLGVLVAGVAFSLAYLVWMILLSSLKQSNLTNAYELGPELGTH